ncbi:MAG: GTP cyclohydrolase II, partial [Gammaproteobacteria bacterium]|nr:GTP cyclohydrolase II [Gammaproteobacteria bacterium]
MTKKKVIRGSTARIPTEYGDFQLCYYTNTEDDKAHLAFYMGDISQSESVLV